MFRMMLRKMYGIHFLLALAFPLSTSTSVMGDGGSAVGNGGGLTEYQILLHWSHLLERLKFHSLQEKFPEEERSTLVFVLKNQGKALNPLVFESSRAHAQDFPF